MLIREDFYFKAANGGHDIFAAYWADKSYKEYRGIFHIAHGMGEDILKYEPFAEFLAKDGYVVCGMDFAGHGKSIDNEDDYGYFGDGEDNWIFLVDDVFRLMKIIKEKFPDIPKYFVMGHSFGSYVMREFIAQYGKYVDGAVIMATSDVIPGNDAVAMLCRVEMELFGPKAEGTAVFKIGTEWFNRKWLPAKTDFDWVSSDEEIVNKYASNKEKRFAFSYGGYMDVYHLTKEVTSNEWYKRIRTDLPILIVSGEQDSLGDFGRGIKKVFNGLKKAGCRRLTMRLFANCRHEILTEKRKMDVYKYILNWTNKQLSRQTKPEKLDIKE